MIPPDLKPIIHAPTDGRPVLVYFKGREPLRRYAVMYFDEGAYLWRTTYGRDFLGPPTHYRPGALD